MEKLGPQRFVLEPFEDGCCIFAISAFFPISHYLLLLFFPVAPLLSSSQVVLDPDCREGPNTPKRTRMDFSDPTPMGIAFSWELTIDFKRRFKHVIWIIFFVAGKVSNSKIGGFHDLVFPFIHTFDCQISISRPSPQECGLSGQTCNALQYNKHIANKAPCRALAIIVTNSKWDAHTNPHLLPAPL